MKPIRTLHVSAHLGGGVGRVLSEVARFRREQGAAVEDTFVCLEAPKTERYLKVLKTIGANVCVSPSRKELQALVANADIVQIEWWHHPLMAEFLTQWEMPESRLVIWSHISGLHYPAIPESFVRLPHAFLFTSGVSLSAIERSDHGEENIVRVVHSSGGFDDIPLASRTSGGQLRFGYLGSLNPAKLHPEIVEYLQRVDVPDFQVEFYGDPSANSRLRDFAGQNARNSPVVLRGYTDEPFRALGGMDVFVYLLNPEHYGTTENALLEAMACGALPVVLNNPVERTIVENGKTGIVVDSPRAFADAIASLCRNPAECRRLGVDSASTVREKCSVENTAAQLETIYRVAMDIPKRRFDFAGVFGSTPSAWFKSCLGKYTSLFEGDIGEVNRVERLRHAFLYERSKSSAFQFSTYFPSDAVLKDWGAMLNGDLTAQQEQVFRYRGCGA
jgi:glycosyltransferase involved in cell wall biosynthesis